MENSRALHDELQRIVGEFGILPEEQGATYTFDGYVPKAVVLPTSVQEIQEVLQFAVNQNLSVMPAGAGTKLGIGNLPQKVDIVLATIRLNSVVEYEPADLTVTVESGIRLRDLQTELAKHRQYLALNPSSADRCTIGGIVATNASGSFRLRHGTARNQVLGLRVVQADGTVVKSGGKVVKNVAGYDLNKLYIGAFGTLGIITEVTLKLSPIPVQQAILTADFQNVQDAADTGLAIVGSQTLPMFVNLCITAENSQLRRDKSSTLLELTRNHRETKWNDAQDPIVKKLVVGFGGDPETVAWQLTQCQEIMEQNGAIGVTSVEDASVHPLQKAVQEFSVDESVVVKLNLKRTDLAEFATQIVEADWTRNAQIMALLGSGVMSVNIPITSDTDYRALADALTQLRQTALSKQGNLIIEIAPPELKRHIDVWGSVEGTLSLMKQIKTKFDPTGLLNPGRFISSI